jgi:hypothetical protein
MPSKEASASRALLMRQAEGNLANGKPADAAVEFERAVSMVHAPDAELGMVRSYMQLGHYREALYHAAHTAGAHRDEPEGMALYVWLLHLGGQEDAAQRLLREARRTAPDNPTLRQVSRGMEQSALSCAGADKLRFRPYSQPAAPGNVRVRGSAVLIDGGRSAIAPAAAVAGARTVWLRNGLGRLSRATPERRMGEQALVLLRLEQPMPLPEGYASAARASFPGSIGFAVEYPVVGSPCATWPRLRNGFLGAPIGDEADLNLGIAVPKSAHGGPVFNGAGSLSGIALPGPQGAVLFHSVERLRREIGDAKLPPAVPTRMRVDIETVYETAMPVTLQVLAGR